MARPKVHGDRATYTVRLAADLLEQLTELAKQRGEAKNDVVVAAIQAAVEAAVSSGPKAVIQSLSDSVAKEQSLTPSEPQLTTESRFSVPVSDCKHPLGHSVRRGAEMLCPACGHVR